MARVPYVTEDELDREFREYLAYEGKTLNVHRATGNNPELMAAFDDFLEALYTHAGLSEREQELVILSVASATGARYVWHQHVWLSRETDITETEIEAISGDAERSSPPASEHLSRTPGELATDQVSDRLHERVSEYLSTDTLVGISMLACAYLATARLLAALDVEIEDGDEFVGW